MAAARLIRRLAALSHFRVAPPARHGWGGQQAGSADLPRPPRPRAAGDRTLARLGLGPACRRLKVGENESAPAGPGPSAATAGGSPASRPRRAPPARCVAHEAAAQAREAGRPRSRPPRSARRSAPRPARAQPERRRTALTHLSFSVPKMEARYSAISHPLPPTRLPTPPTLPTPAGDVTGRDDAPARRGGATQSEKAPPTCGQDSAHAHT